MTGCKSPGGVGFYQLSLWLNPTKGAEIALVRGEVLPIFAKGLLLRQFGETLLQIFIRLY